MRYLHTMVRIANIEQSLDFYIKGLGMVEVRRRDNPAGRYTVIFLAFPDDLDSATKTGMPLLELTYNYDPETFTPSRFFGHLGVEVDDISAVCAHLQAQGVTINRPPRDGRMAFVKSPDGISIELIQKAPALEPAEPWVSMPNTGSW